MRHLHKDPNVKAACKSVIQEFIDQSTVELVMSETLTQMMISLRVDLYFLPHRAVYDLGWVSTKCQVVMDTSVKMATGKSLNDCLLPGPPLQQQIAAVELRFCRQKVTLIRDCKKIFCKCTQMTARFSAFSGMIRTTFKLSRRFISSGH